MLLLLLVLGACTAQQVDPSSYVAPPTTQRAGAVLVVTDVLMPDTTVTGDVDDFIALNLLKAAGVEPALIVTVAGNGPEALVMRSARRLPALGPVYTGASDCSAGGVEAIRAILAARQVTILALGPVTALARALECSADLPHQVDELIFVGGRTRGELFYLADWVPAFIRPFRDLNFEVDRDAMRSVIRSGLPITIVPFAAGRAVRLSPNELAPHFSDRANEAFRDLAATLLPVGGGGALPAFDPVAAAYVLWPDLFVCQSGRLTAGSDLLFEPAKGLNSRRCMPRDPVEVRGAVVSMLKNL